MEKMEGVILKKIVNEDNRKCIREENLKGCFEY